MDALGIPRRLVGITELMRIKIAPSILSADFARLGAHVQEVEAAGCDMLHVDVMDGHFVPNLSMGPIVVEALKRTTNIPLDVHLMITDPATYAESFIKAGADLISFHSEVVDDPRPLARQCREAGVGVGLVLNPDTPVEKVLDVLPEFDMILVMTVHPGFSGQSFLPENLSKVRAIRETEKRLRAEGSLSRPLDVEVDGGIDLKTCAAAREAGANVFVAGSAIFDQPAPGDIVREMRRSLESIATGPQN